MSQVLKKIVNWLYSVLQPQYLHKELVFNDIYRFLAVYLAQGFKIRTAVFTSALGASNLLVNLYGTLNCQNIEVPLTIWVPLNYPFADESVALTEPNGMPIVFVVPNQELSIRPGNNVDLQGRFYHPYLSLWHVDNVPGPDNQKYNLLNLMSCLIATFNRVPPLGRPPIVTGPELPPKPAALSPHVTGQLAHLPRRETNGPGLPQKQVSADDSIPLKYRSPLPIPSEKASGIENGSYSNIRIEDGVPGFTATNQSSYQTDYWTPPPKSISSHSRTMSPPYPRAMSPPRSFVNYSNASPAGYPLEQHKSPTPVGDAEIENLMDKVTLDTGKSTIPRDALEQISHHINLFLTLEGPDNVNSVVAKINENSQRILALYSQLEHHNKQAAANKENLDKHITYLSGQVEAIKTLNTELGELDKLNSASTDEIYTDLASGRKMKIEDIITPDLKLVHQLYDVTADIKACKDAIKLVGGGFKSEEEMINNENLDSCVKAARGLGRELFWLKVTKQNIARTMGLS